MDIEKLLAPTKQLFEALEVYQATIPLRPNAKHYTTHIKLLDFKFNRSHLVERLREAVIRWVFSRKEAERIFNEGFNAASDYGAASTLLYTSARDTIRVSAPQGQFGELLLNGFLQHLFKAVPLLRKQPVRTSDNLERFGSDAIHVTIGETTTLFLGESKCYKSSYKFATAFQASLESICTSVENFESEIKKFHVGGFIEDELKGIASAILRNEVEDLKICPVCIVIYNEHEKLSGDSSAERKKHIEKIIFERCSKVSNSIYDAIDETTLGRCLYIIFPVWELDKLLEEFTNAL
jgi:hypothetical protein